MNRFGIATPTSLALLVLLTRLAAGTTVDLTSGTTGTLKPGQSFNETRGADVTILGGTDVSLLAMTVLSINLGTSGTLGARVYDSNSQALLASANTAVSSGSNQTVSIPIATTLVVGKSYRICFFLSASSTGSCTLFDPDPLGSGGHPYNDATGTVRINSNWAFGADAFPINTNLSIPLMSLTVAPRCIDLTAGPSGSTTPVPQSFNETRGVDVRLEGPDDLYLDRMTLNGLYISTPTATVGARVYNSSMQLLASADVGVTSGANQIVTVPITEVLVAGSTYRVCFFVAAGGSGGSGRMFDPDPPSIGGFPYVEGTGTIRVLGAYSLAADAYPTNSNIFVPLMTLCVQSALVDVPAPSGADGWEVSAVRPNPVVDLGTLDFRLPERSRVVIEQFSVTGARVVRTEAVLGPGRHSMSVSSRSLREGIYFLRYNAFAPSGERRFTISRKMAVLGR